MTYLNHQNPMPVFRRMISLCNRCLPTKGRKWIRGAFPHFSSRMPLVILEKARGIFSASRCSLNTCAIAYSKLSTRSRNINPEPSKSSGEHPRFKPAVKQHSKNLPIDKDAKPRPPADPKICSPRPPVVGVLGHVDHGKTTLLDALRASRTVDSEFGGITQHLAAFTVSLSKVAVQAGLSNLSPVTLNLLCDHITFLDTPGHAAFSGIRERGAAATDIVVLVVGADDGVMPQTIESIRFAKESNTPLVVAVNKIDKHGIDVEAVLHELAMYDVVVEQLGGDVQAVEISALRRINLHRLLEAICVQSELMQLKADPSGPCEGVVLEANIEELHGKITTCLVTRGKLRRTPQSGPLIAGETFCSPRYLLNDLGQRVDFVEPGYIARVPGWKDLPPAGSLLLELPSVSRLHEVIRFRAAQRLRKMTESSNQNATVHASVSSQVTAISLPLIIKADTHGSLEAIGALLKTCPSDCCTIEFHQSGVGPLTLSEVEYAKSLKAVVLLFNVASLSSAQQYAQEHGITVKSFNIIYRLAEEVRDLINQRLPPLVVEKVIGEGEILALFTVKEGHSGGKQGRFAVAGCRCTKGHLVSSASSLKSLPERDTYKDALGAFYRVIRPERSASTSLDDAQNSVDPLRTGTVLIDHATCHSLKHERSPVDTVRKHVECGIALITTSNDAYGSSMASGYQPTETFFSQWQVGDLIQCYALVKQAQTIEWDFDTRTTATE